MRHAISIPVLVLVSMLASTSSAQPLLSLNTPTTDPPVPRLRLGGEIGGGVAYGATHGGALGAYGQIGAQITRELGLFYQGALFGYGFTRESSLKTFLVDSNSAMVDLTFRNVAQVGIGGGVDIGKFSWCDYNTTGLCQSTGREAHPSLSLRAAFLVAFARRNSRWGVPIALHAHTMLWDHRAQNSLLITVGFSRY